MTDDKTDEEFTRIYATNPDVPLTDPVTGQKVGAEGLRVRKDDRHWLRRLRDGDATTTAPGAGEAKDHAIDRTSGEREKGV